MTLPQVRNNVGYAVTSVASAGTGTITLGSAISGYAALVAGDDALTFDAFVLEGTAFEHFRAGAYTHSGTTLTRGTFESSSTGSAVAFTSAAQVFLHPSAERAKAWLALSSVMGEEEVSITGTATATANRMHVCSGTSADYTVTLPAASTAKWIGVRMSGALTKLVTLDGNSTETLDGATTRVMHDNEVAILRSDGSDWFKIAGQSIPLQLMLQRSTVTGDQSFSSSVWTACETPEKVFGTDLMNDTTNKRIKIVRSGKYFVAAAFYIAGTTVTVCYGTVGKSQAANTTLLANLFVTSTVGAGSIAGAYECAVGDYLVASSYTTGTSPRFESDAPTTIYAAEVPSW